MILYVVPSPCFDELKLSEIEVLSTNSPPAKTERRPEIFSTSSHPQWRQHSMHPISSLPLFFEKIREKLNFAQVTKYYPKYI